LLSELARDCAIAQDIALRDGRRRVGAYRVSAALALQL
jgi:hypothetical protein